jgi:hypothetical protein
MRCLVCRKAEAGGAEGYGWLGEGRSGNGGGCGFSCLAKWGGRGRLRFFLFQGGSGGFGLRRRKGYDF